MATPIKLKRSSVPGKIPTIEQIELGEIAINTNDGVLYLKKDDGAESIVKIKEVTENNLEINSSTLENSNSQFLSDVLADLDSAISSFSGSGLSSTFNIYEYNVTTQQTVFDGADSNGNILSYDLGSGTELSKVKVYLNGILLDHDTDFTADDGTSIVLSEPAVDGDVLAVGAYKSFSSFANDLQLSDDQKICFGDDLDLCIFHDGSNSILSQTGTGDILIKKDNNTVAEFTADGIVTPSIQLSGGINDQGTLSWNAEEETLDLIHNGSIHQIGQAVQYHVRNNTGSLIPKGTPVMATGTIGMSSRITVAPMDGTNPANAKFFLGVTTTDIPDDTDGKVSHFGKIRQINTSAYNEGDVLYISTTNVGQFTNVEPTSGMKLPVAFVITSHANVGAIVVRATNGLRVRDLNDVNFAGLANNNILSYNASTETWVPIENSTTNTVEGTNLYFTTARANTAIDNKVTKEFVDDLATETTTLSTTTETPIASFSSTTYGSAKLLIQATQGGNRHITEVLITHDGTTASATEYGTITTNGSLFSIDVDINNNNIRVLATGATSNSTVYKVYKTLIKA